MPVKLFIRKKPRVEAIQVKPDNWNEVTEFMQASRNGRCELIYLINRESYKFRTYDGESYSLKDGDWLVLEDGVLTPYSDAALHETFEVDDDDD